MRQATVLGEGPWCGTANGYFYHKCRCSRCRAAKVKHKQKYQKTLKSSFPVGMLVWSDRWGWGVIESEMTGDGYVRVKFDRTYKLKRTKSVKELHYSRLEKISEENSSN